MAESNIKIKASFNEMDKEFKSALSKYYYVDYYDGDKTYKGDDDEKIIFDACIRHNEIGDKSIERRAPYTFKTLEKTLEKYVKEYEEDCVTNKNFLYEPVKKDKYFISENDYYNIVKKVENGYKVRKEDEFFYILTYGWQGNYYKDYEAFKNGDDVCYIPEYNYVNDDEKCLIISEKVNSNNKYYRKDIIKEVKNELCGKVYKDFFNGTVPENLINHISEIVFDIVDWQHPSSYLYETEWDDTIKEYFINYPDDIDKYASKELKIEILNMINKKYKIGVKESYYTVFEVDGYSYENAVEQLENKINNSEIYLDNISSYQRTYTNHNSKELDLPFNIRLEYYPYYNKATIFSGKNKGEYKCFTALDIAESLKNFCDTYIEDHELVEKNNEEKENEIIYEK